MDNSIVCSDYLQNLLEVKNGEIRIDSRIVCEGLGRDNHTAYRKDLLQKYEDRFSSLGVIFKITLDSGEIVWYLNEAQVNFAVTLATNTERAVEFKINLVKAFEFAKQKIRTSIKEKVIDCPKLSEIRASYGLWKMAHGKAYADRWLAQMHQKWYPALVGDAPKPEESASLPTAKALLTPTQIAEQLGLYCKSNAKSGDARRVNKLLQELGYQTKIDGVWSATDKAIDLNLCDRKPIDTGSRTQKDQLMWSADILVILQEHTVEA
jgi:phage regulator Rha-like protein